MEKSIRVRLGSQDLSIVDESTDHSINIYIPHMFQLMQVDSRDDSIDYIKDIVNDVSQHRLQVFAYNLMGKEVFDFKLADGGDWADYPRPQTLLMSLIKRFGRARSIGYLEINDLPGKDPKS